MNLRTAVTLGVAAAMLGGLSWGLYRLGMQQGMEMALAPMPGAMDMNEQASADPALWTTAQGEEATRRHIDQGIRAGDIDPVTGREVLHYYDPMLPASKFEAPGKSPFMDMMLVPAYAGAEGAADAGTVSISARVRQNTGIRSAVVTEGSLSPVVRAVGTVSWNGRDEIALQARAMGFVERLHVKAALDPVDRGQALLELRIPQWVALQEEYLALRRMRGEDLAPLLEAARARMLQAGMNEEQIRRVEESGELQERVTLTSPVRGVVSELGVREGMTVQPGTMLFRLNGTETVWADAEVPESQVGLLREGGQVSALSPAVPGLRFEGRIQSLLPEVDPALRTRGARLELANPQGLLVPGMLLDMELAAAPRAPSLLVPTEAVIVTGRRTMVMLDEGDGEFLPVAVQTGIEAGGQTEILSGLSAGQRVVASGQFLLDSEASLRGLATRLGAELEVEGATP